jgi:ferredoxin
MEELRSTVAEKLEELDGVLALRRTEMGTAPYLFREGGDFAPDLSELVLEPRYPLGKIVKMLQKRYPEAQFGVVARACDARALVEMSKREQVDLERLELLGVACTAEEAVACACADPAPAVEVWAAATVIGTPAEAGAPNPLVAEYAEKSLEERLAFWRQQFRKCIKCYGCRDICPVCFCEACALEDPLWVEPGVLSPPFPMYHLIKAMHMSNRCVACRQCELACPAHIPLTVLYDLIRQDVESLLGYVPGTDLDSAPPIPLTFTDAPIRGEK